MSWRTLLTIVAVVLLAGLIYTMFGRGGNDTVTVWYQLKGEARGQKYYLAKRMLEANGVEVTSVNTYAKLLPLDDVKDGTTLFFTESTKSLTDRQIIALKTWVQNGGHLITRGDVDVVPYSRQVDRLGDLIERAKKQAKKDESEEEADNDDADDEADSDNESENTSDTWYGEEWEDVNVPLQKADVSPALLAEFGLTFTAMCFTDIEHDYPENVAQRITSPIPMTVNANYGVKYDMDNMLENIDGNSEHIQQTLAKCKETDYSLVDNYRYGRGKLTVYHTPSLLFSDRPHGNLRDVNRKARIAEYDHASYLLYILSQNGELPEHVMWFESPFFPSYLDMLKKYGFPALLAIIFATLAFIWRHLRRFGPLIEEDTRKSLSLKRHLRASGQFLYANDARDVLLRDTQQAMFAELSKAIRHLDKLDKDKRIDAVVALTKLPQNTVTLALADIRNEHLQKEALFTQTIKAIQTIRETL